jgi:replicative DNA helicase
VWGLGKNVGYISPEMSCNAIGYRFDTLNEHFSNTALTRGNDIPDYVDYVNKIKQDNIDHDIYVSVPAEFNKRITISKLRNYCLQHRLDMLCIDGITYLSDERYKHGDNKTTSLTNISEDLMELSLELGIPIVTVVQANRGATGVEVDVPELENIRDSDGIAQNATKVLSIRQNGEYLNMVVKKNRNGPVNVKLSYKWDIDHGTFEYSEKYMDASQVVERNTNSSYSERRNTEPVVNKQPIRAAERKGLNDMFAEAGI